MLRRAARRHGMVGLLKVTLTHVCHLFWKLKPEVRAEGRRRRAEEATFDSERGVDTGGWIRQARLNVTSPNQIHATTYAGSNPGFFREAIKSLPIHHKDFVFVDFGSGKGRAVLLAAEFPFKKVIGLEFSEELHRVAEANLRRVPQSLKTCADIELRCMDVTDYVLPVEDLVCYFCNPFDSALMVTVMSRIERSLRSDPRQVIVVYHTPVEASVIDRLGCFTPMETRGCIRTWKATPQASRLLPVLAYWFTISMGFDSISAGI